MSDEKADTAAGCVYILLLPVWLTYSGCALKTLWWWFVVPLGLPALTLGQSIGIGIICAFVTHQTPGPNARPPFSELLWVEAYGPAVVLGLGWLVHRFVA